MSDQDRGGTNRVYCTHAFILILAFTSASLLLSCARGDASPTKTGQLPLAQQRLEVEGLPTRLKSFVVEWVVRE
ncbi:hypothetical protein BD779DRAFT_1672147 [Infundibulicybe gibba]|nr:hypothetical protein BD779DRAFT_1672147 [Infundibulicybe gibba]